MCVIVEKQGLRSIIESVRRSRGEYLEAGASAFSVKGHVGGTPAFVGQTAAAAASMSCSENFHGPHVSTRPWLRASQTRTLQAGPGPQAAVCQRPFKP